MKPTDLGDKRKQYRHSVQAEICDGVLYVDKKEATAEQIRSFLAQYPHRAKELKFEVARTYLQLEAELAAKGFDISKARLQKTEEDEEEVEDEDMDIAAHMANKRSSEKFQELLREAAESRPAPPGGQRWGVQLKFEPRNIFIGVRWDQKGSWLDVDIVVLMFMLRFVLPWRPKE